MAMRTCSEVAGHCTMAGCASRCQIYLRANDTDPSVKLQATDAPLVNISAGDYNIGLFQHEDATRRGGGRSIHTGRTRKMDTGLVVGRCVPSAAPLCSLSRPAAPSF